jgi:hypothetical protein
MKRFLRIYSTLFLTAVCLCAGSYASGVRKGITSIAWLLSKQSQPGAILFNGEWYFLHGLSTAMAEEAAENIFATCGGTVGGTGQNDDLDGDGVCNVNDIDDDNDGVVDAVESPDCFYTLAEAQNLAGGTVRSDFAWLSNNPLTNTYDGNSTTIGWVNPAVTNIAGLGLVDFTLPIARAALISNVQIEVGVTALSSSTSALWQLEGWNGTSWVALSATQAMNTPSTTYTFGNTLQAGTKYGRYRIAGTSTTAGVPANGRLAEVHVNYKNYVASEQPKASCVNDTDGDGTLNHLDLDSDGDGCPDAVEAGVSINAAANGSMSASGGPIYTGGIASGTAKAYVGNGAPAQYGDNGLFNDIETGTESGIYNSTYTYYYAKNNVHNLCLDTDGDGVGDLIDIDDDNDGVLDVVEAGCNLKVGYNTTSASGISNLFSYYGLTPGTTLYNQLADDIGLVFSETASFASGVVLSNVCETSIQGTTYNTDIWIKSVNPANISQSVPLHSISFKNDCQASTPEYLTYSAYDINGSLQYTYNIAADPSITQTSGYKFDLVMDQNYDVYSIKITRNANAAVVIGATLGTGNGFAPCAMTLDTDGDGIPNSLDLDSDGDGCPDALEAGVSANPGASGSMSASGGSIYTGGITSGTANAYVGNGTLSQYGTNGFFNGIETSSESGVYNQHYTYAQYALGGNLNLCANTDNDGLSDLVDLDDDNDGILDAVESPGCFYTTAEAIVTSKISTGVTSSTVNSVGVMAGNDVPTMHDGTGTTVAASNHIVAANQLGTTSTVIYKIEYPTAVGLTQMTVTGATASWGTGAFAVLEGSNDDAIYAAVSAPVAISSGTTKTWPVTVNATNLYKYYRIRVSTVGSTQPTFTNFEVAGTINTATYIPSAHPKPSCVADGDGDGIVNHHDLDSDGDGCPDATEGGGGFTTGDLHESDLPGGNTGANYTGQVTFGVDDNLGNNVDASGVPAIANGGQVLGQSQTAGTPCAQIEPCELTISGTVFEDRDNTNPGVNGNPYTRGPLYVSLVVADMVQSVDTVAADGTYRFTGVLAGTYKVVLTTVPTGSVNASLPSGVIAIGEGGGIDPVSGHSMGDGTPDATASATLSCPAGNAQIDFGIDSSMPVTLVSLTASQATEGTLLQWLTADEKDFDRFEIEQSALPQAGFVKIGEVKGGRSEYSFTDAMKRNGASYYRLKMVDTDGTYSYSRIVTVTKRDGVDLHRVYPNPVADGRISISSVSPIESYQVYDAGGKAVAVKMSAQNGTYTFLFGKDIPSGLYVIQYRAAGRVLSQQFALVR